MSIIIFIIIIAILVFIHELGHFLAAKFFNIRVDEFAIGFPPRIASFKRGETRYSLNALPLGGYVKIHDEREGDSDASSRSFAHVSWWKKIIVLSAGVIFNILLAWILISATLMFPHVSPVDSMTQGASEDQFVIVMESTPDMPAYDAGILSGDRIVSVNDQSILNEIDLSDSLSNQTDVTLEVKRNGKLLTVDMGPVYDDNGQAIIGITIATFTIESLPFFQSMITGAQSTWHMTGAIASAFVDLISGRADFSSLSGPVGIVGVVGETGRHAGIIGLLTLTAIISINLAVLNIIPFPALDGGRILIVGIELLIRRPLPEKLITTINGLGFVLLIILMIVITAGDITRLFS